MEWISIIDRLPELNKDVLVHEKYSDIPFVGHRKIKRNFSSEEIIWAANKEFYNTDGNANVVDIITQGMISHWMPLPAPPKQIEP